MPEVHNVKNCIWLDNPTSLSFLYPECLPSLWQQYEHKIKCIKGKILHLFQLSKHNELLHGGCHFERVAACKRQIDYDGNATRNGNKTNLNKTVLFLT